MNDSIQPNPADFSSEVAKAHGPSWLNLLGHLAGQRNIIGIELGTWRGESAEWMLDNIFTAQDARYLCVDTFKGSAEHALAGIDCSGLKKVAEDRLKRFRPRVTVIESTTNEFLRNVGDYYFVGEEWRELVADLVYVDAAHDAMNVLRDAVLAFDLLKIGGILLFDDYLWTVMPDEVDRPKLAIDGFLAAYARSLEIVSFGGWQVAVRRTS